MKKNRYWTIIIAIVFLIAIATYILVQIHQYNEENEKLQQEIMKSGEKFRKDIDNATGKNTSIQDIYYEIETVHCNSEESNK